MGFFDKVKKVFGSENDVESQNTDELAESLKNDNSNENKEIEHIHFEESVLNDNVDNEHTLIRNFKYLDDLIHSGMKEIVLDSDIVLDPDEESQYMEGIKLDMDDLSIDGNGHTIDAQGKTRIFYCTGNIIIKNIILKNGYAKFGGAINKDNGELTITESTFNNNTAQEYGGGAIDNDNGELTITGSAFNNNTAKTDGGAINNDNGELTITGSAFNNNTAKNNGGAIYNKGELTITESTLTENTAKFSGGAIDNWEKLTIIKSTLTRNSVEETSDFSRSGGAIRNLGGELKITESTLTRNRARDGGAIYNNGTGELTITESLLQENSAQNGGAINNYKGNFKIFNCEFLNNKSPYNIILNNDSLQIYNTDFNDNPSKYVVLNEDDGANLGIFNGEFSENNVEESVLCNTGKFCSVEKTVFENNISSNTMNIINKSELTLTDPKIKDNGKSILNEKYILMKNSSPELENIICGEGTVENIKSRIIKEKSFNFGYLDEKIHERKTKEIILDQDITFDNYEIDFYEGGIELDMDDLIINGNGHTIDGADKSRIFIITGKNITLKNIIFKNGRSHNNYDNPLNSNGGAIKINYNSNIIIENCEFIDNTSEKFGGAIHNNSFAELTITDSTLTGNTADSNGGAIYNDNGELTITESTLTGNTVQENDFFYGGGAIHNSGGVLTITDSTLNNNTSHHLGGAIYNDKGEATIMDSTLTGNTADSNGGAIYNYEGELIITESTLNNNKSQNLGGAIFNDWNGVLTITKSILNNNAAQSHGGAICNHIAELTVTDSTFTGNKEQGTYMGGGAIFHDGGKINVLRSALIENIANEKGGAIYIRGQKYELENCTYKGNIPDNVYQSNL